MNKKHSSLLAVALLISAVIIAGCVGQTSSQTNSAQSGSASEYATVKDAMDADANIKCDFVDISDQQFEKNIYISDGKVRRVIFVRGYGPDAKTSTAITVYNDGKLYNWVEDEESNPSNVATIDEAEAQSRAENGIYFDRAKIDTLFETSLVFDNTPSPLDRDSEITCNESEEKFDDSLFALPVLSGQ